MSDQNQANLTIGQLFELNQGKNATQIADNEARARKAAASLGLDYNKMTETPEQISSVADEINTQKQLQQVIASDPVLGKYALDPNQAAVSLDDFGTLKKSVIVFHYSVQVLMIHVKMLLIVICRMQLLKALQQSNKSVCRNLGFTKNLIKT